MRAIDLIRRLRRHQAWTNERLPAAARPLSIDALRRTIAIGQGSLLATLAHRCAAEFAWLEAIDGNAAPISPFDVRFESLGALADVLRGVDARWDALMKRLDDDALERSVAKPSTSIGAGQTFVTPLADVLRHVFTHTRNTRPRRRR